MGNRHVKERKGERGRKKGKTRRNKGGRKAAGKVIFVIYGEIDPKAFTVEIKLFQQTTNKDTNSSILR